MQKDYYHILGISQNTEQAQIKPNAQSVLSQAQKEYETHQLEIKKAYAVIANLAQRKAYDRQLKITSSTAKTYYQILRMAPDTEQRLIKALTLDTAKTVKQEYESQIAYIREAYSILNDTEKRAAYDNTQLQEEKRIEALKRKRQEATILQDQAPKNRFSLNPVILATVLIGLVYFGYTQHQENAAAPANKPVAIFSTDSLTAAAKSSPPSIERYFSDSAEEPFAEELFADAFEVEENPPVHLATPPSKNIYSSADAADQSEEMQSASSISRDYKEEAENIQAAERQPESLTYYSWEEGAGGYETIMDTAHSLEEPVIVYFHADWCPWCEKLGRDYFSDYQLQNFLDNILRVKITPDNSKDEKELFKQYKGTGYPTVFVYVPAFGNSPVKMYPFRKGKDWSPEQYRDKIRGHIVREYSKQAYRYLNKREYEQARYYYRKALLYEPENADFYYYIGFIYHKEGDEKRELERLWLAKQNYLEALKHDPEHKNSQRNLERLKNL
ncbi:MAG: hypothetical protein DRR16_32740 [Candidatus Parabeggiatoa sp. nov. 3]|nr:MAG: hypothetical protein DRR00_14390 [Gammaproteobacteria bacterium]RKZ73795.1 MAG: hypothetical protein DRR16_32740 [Gammaproteobacteria bacterium]